MSETTYEEARRCAKCQQPGELTNRYAVAQRSPSGEQRKIAPGTQMHVFTCMNERCRWHGQTCRIVQVNPDGSIPPPTMKRDKQFPAVPDLTRQVNEQLEAQLHAEAERGEIPWR